MRSETLHTTARVEHTAAIDNQIYPSAFTKTRFKPLVFFQIKTIIFVVTLLISLGSFTQLFAVDRTTVKSGNWNDATVWGGGVVPLAADRANIQHAVTLTANATCQWIVLVGGVSSSLTTGTYTLTVTNGGFNGITMNSGSSLNIGGVLNVTGGIYTPTVFTPWVTPTVTFNGTDQTIKGTTYPNLILSGGVKTSNGPIEIIVTPSAQASLTLNSGATLTMGANPLTLNGSFTNNGTFTPATGNITIAGTIGASIGSFTTTGNVSFIKTAGTVSFTGNVSAANLTINGTGGTLNLGAGKTHTFSGNVALTAGTLNGGSSILNVNGTSTTAWGGTGTNFTAGLGTVVFGGGNQTLAATSTFNNLIFSGTGTKSLSGLTIINGSFSIGNGVVANLGTFASTANSLILGGNGQVSGLYGGTGSGATYINPTYFAAATGTLDVGTATASWTGATSTDWHTASNWSDGTVPLASTNVSIPSGGNQPVIGAAAVANNITINSGATLTIAGSNTLTVSGHWTNLGTFTANSSTVILNGAAQSVGTGPYNNLTIAGSGLKTLIGVVTVNGVLSMEGTGTPTVSVAPTYGPAATLQYNTTIARNIGVEWSSPFTATGGVVISNTGVISYNASKTFNAGVPLTINNGATLNIAVAQNLNLGGDFINNGTFIPHATTTFTVTFNGTGVQTIGGTSVTPFHWLTINNPAGVILGNNVTVGNRLTLTNGIITTGSNTLIISSSTATVVRTIGHVFGNFQKNFATGAITKIFEVGDALIANYTPVTVSFASVTTAGNIVVKSTAGDHPQISTSSISSSKGVNRYWTITNAGIAFTTATATLNWVAGDVEGGANYLNFIIGKYDNPTWTLPTYGTRNSTNIQATGLISFSDFQVGEQKPPAPTAFAVTGGGSYHQGGVGVPVGLANSETGVTYTLFKDDVAQVPTVPGTGAPISFGNQLFGIYTVSGTNLDGTTLMTGSATITEMPPLPNVALNKPATSQSYIITGYEPSKANDADGTNNSYWDGSGYPKWWEVNLGGIYDLTNIVVRNWVDGSRYYQYTVEASIDGQAYTQIAAKTNTDPATDAGDAYAFNVTAKYLRVNMTLNSANPSVHISDFRAHGALSTSILSINSSAGTGGSISPLGDVVVASGASQTYTITPAVGYAISDVLIDGASQGAMTSYTFTNVTVSHTISATFTSIENIALNKPATSDSYIITGYDPSKANDTDGTNNSYWSGTSYPKWWEVNLGGIYDLTSIVVRNYVGGSRYYQYTVESSIDGQTYTQIAAKTNNNPATDAGDVYAVSATAKYLRVNMSYNSANTGVHITDFRAYGALSTSMLTINSSAGAGGSISPLGDVVVASGGSQTYTITPAVGYVISSVLVDGASQGALTTFTFSNVTVSHTISATFTSLENIALNKPATSDSYIIPGYEPSKANDIDGTNNSYWSGTSYPKWWEVNLGGIYDLTSIVVRNWVGGSRYYQYTVESSIDGQTYTQIAAKTNTNPATDAGDVYAVSATAKYLRVNMTYNSANPGVHITDFRAYGALSTSVLSINSSAGIGGSISPLGDVVVASGGSQTYTITPAVGYTISSVLVDGAPQAPVTSYTFTNVTVSHTISATFTSLENIALNKPATSQAAIYTGYEPSKANDTDGTNNSYWDGSVYPKWWEVNLGGVYDVTSIVVRNWVDGSRYYQYTVEASIDGLTYTPIAAKNNTDAATDAGDVYPVSATAQYLRVTMTYNSANPGVHISDFRAYGSVHVAALGNTPLIIGAKGSNTSASVVGKQSTENDPDNLKLNVYPNPFADHVTIRIDSPVEEMFDVSIINLQGGKVHFRTEIPANTDNTFNLQLAKGIYILRVNNILKIMTQRIVKN